MKTPMQEWAEWLKAYEYELPLELQIKAKELLELELKNNNWTNFESELMDWAHELGQEQKYTPYPSQVLEWLKKNYTTPNKKIG
jgi:hypothetical protein